MRGLVAQGVKEFQIIEQELTYYGVDLDGKHHITELISRMADIEGGRVDSPPLCLPKSVPT